MDRRRKWSPADLGSGAHGMDEKASRKVRKIRPGDAFIPRRVILDANLVSELYGRLLARPTPSLYANVLEALAREKSRVALRARTSQADVRTNPGMINHTAENSLSWFLQLLHPCH